MIVGFVYYFRHRIYIYEADKGEPLIIKMFKIVIIYEKFIEVKFSKAVLRLLFQDPKAISSKELKQLSLEH